MKIAKTIRQLHTDRQIKDDELAIPKLDATRDFRGSFYAPGDWKTKYLELKEALEREFDTKFRDNGNSFDTCFQYEGKFKDGSLHGRAKI